MTSTIPITGELRLSAALVAYMVIIHLMAMVPLYQWYRRLTDRVSTRASGSSRGQGEQPRGDDRRGRTWMTATDTLELFTADELRILCWDREMSTMGMTKTELIEKFLTSGSRATDRQLGYMAYLHKADDRLIIRSADVDDVTAATRWISAALAEQPTASAAAASTTYG
jgi:hypothetical protein